MFKANRKYILLLKQIRHWLLKSICFLPAMEIPYPNHKSKFDIQAELYSKLKSAGYDVFGEEEIDRTMKELFCVMPK